MRGRWVIAVGVALIGAAAAHAQPLPPPAPPPGSNLSLGPTIPTTPAPTARPSSVARDGPVPGQPPLLPVPPGSTNLPAQPNAPGPPLPEVPRPGPGGEYDPGYLYLPDRLPERRTLGDEVCGPPGTFWFAPSLELSWMPTRPAPTTVRLRLADPASFGGTVPGPLVPVAGRSAGRFEAALGLTFGTWFGETNTHGVEASLFLRDANNTFETASPGVVVLFPNGPGRSVPHVIAFSEPAAVSLVSTFPVTLGTFFATVDVNYRHKLVCGPNGRLDALVGYRYAFLGDELYLGELPDGDHDEYRRNRASVSNAFHGGQIGLAGEFRANGWYVAGSAKVAFGAVSPEVTTTGLFWGAEGRVGNRFRPLGALTRTDESEFAVLPAFSVQIGRQIGASTRLFVGYSFMHLSRAARLGDALDPFNARLPLSTFWVQSIGLGAEFRF